MAFSQEGDAVIHRAPLACDVVTRITSTGVDWTRDAYLQNAYIENNPDTNEPFVCKRPGLASAYTSGGTTLVTGQGLFNYGINGVLILFSIVNNTLYRLTGGTINYGSADVNTTWVTQTPVSPPARTDVGTAAFIVFKNQIMGMGGFDTVSNRNVASVTSTTDGITWTTLTSSAQWAGANSGRSGVLLAVLNEKLYLMNGAVAAYTFNDCWFTNDGVDWTQAVADMGLASGILPRLRCATVTFNNNIVMIAGVEYSPAGVGTYANTVVSSPDGVSWSKNLTPTFTARADIVGCVYKGAIYILGGQDGVGAYQNEVWKSTDGNAWTLLTPVGWSNNRGKVFSSVVVKGDTMYAFAAYDIGGNLHEAYSSTDGTNWTALSATPWGIGVKMKCVVFKPPLNYTGYPQYPQDVIWGIDCSTIPKQYFTPLNVNYSTSYSIATGGTTSDQYEKIEMNLGRYLVIKNTSDGWYFTANSVNKIVDQNYPSSTVRGVVNLASRAYVLDTLANIRGSRINDPTVWPGDNYIRADFAGDAPVCLATYSNYMAVFKTLSTMFFSANGKSVGNTVSPILNANMRVGCGQAYSVVEMANTIFFMSTYGGLRRSISKLDGFSPVKVSSDDVDRILDNNPCTTVFSFSLKMGGQQFYVLTLTDAPATTLVYNNLTGKWAIWASGADGVTTGTLPLRGINRAGLGQNTYVQDRQTNGVFQVSDTSFQDVDQSSVATAITVVIQPDKVDANSHQPKVCASIDIIGDYYASTNPLTVAKSNNDGVTFTTVGTAELSNLRPHVNRGGIFTRRIHRFTHTANQPLRVSAYEITIEPGDV